MAEDWSGALRACGAGAARWTAVLVLAFAPVGGGCFSSRSQGASKDDEPARDMTEADGGVPREPRDASVFGPDDDDDDDDDDGDSPGPDPTDGGPGPQPDAGLLPSDGGVPDDGARPVVDLLSPSGDLTVYADALVPFAMACQTMEGAGPASRELTTPDGVQLLGDGLWFPTPGEFVVTLACEDALGRRAEVSRRIRVLDHPRVLFTASLDQPGQRDLYMMDLSDPSMSRRLSPDSTALGGPPYRVHAGPHDGVLVIHGVDERPDYQAAWALYADATPRLERLVAAGPGVDMGPTGSGALIGVHSDTAFALHAFDLSGAAPTGVTLELAAMPVGASFNGDYGYLIYAPGNAPDAPRLRDLSDGSEILIPVPGLPATWQSRMFRQAHHFSISTLDNNLVTHYLGRLDDPGSLMVYDPGEPMSLLVHVAGERVLVVLSGNGTPTLYTTDLTGGDRVEVAPYNQGPFDVCGDAWVVASADGVSFFRATGSGIAGPETIAGAGPLTHLRFRDDCGAFTYWDGADAVVVELDPAAGPTAHRLEAIALAGRLRFSAGGGFVHSCENRMGRVFGLDGRDTGYQGGCLLAFAPDDGYFVAAEPLAAGVRPQLVRLVGGLADIPEPLTAEAIWRERSNPTLGPVDPSQFVISPSGSHIFLSAGELLRPDDPNGLAGVYEVTVADLSLRQLLGPPQVPAGDVTAFESLPGRGVVLMSGDLVHAGVQNVYAADLASPGLGIPLQVGGNALVDAEAWQMLAGLTTHVPVQLERGTALAALRTDAGDPDSLARLPDGAIMLGLDGAGGVLYATTDRAGPLSILRRSPPDGRDTTLWARSDGFEPIGPIRHQPGAQRLVFTGARTADGSEHQVFTLDYDGQLTRISDPDLGAVRVLFVEAAGQRMAYEQCQGPDCELHVRRSDGSGGFREAVQGLGRELVFAPGRPEVAFLAADGLRLADGQRGGPSWRVVDAGANLRELRFNGNGRFLSYCAWANGCSGRLLRVLPSEAAERPQLLHERVAALTGEAPDGPVTPVAFSPAHDQLLVRASEAGVERTYLVPLLGSGPPALVSVPMAPDAGMPVDTLRDVQFDPSGAFLLVRLQAGEPPNPTNPSPAPAHVLSAYDLTTADPVGLDGRFPVVHRIGWVH